MWKAPFDIFHNVVSTIRIFYTVEITMQIFHYTERLKLSTKVEVNNLYLTMCNVNIEL